MYRIWKITAHPVVDFAAEELKKYLRMMMPRCGEIPIAYDPAARDGFRLGLMEDFGLSVAEAADPFLDDILHIDAREDGGVLAGSNPRSVLLAVYKYLTLNGCRWLFPGVDGEYIPVREICPVSYHKMADCRFRGQCNEGAESQQAMLETIDFAPKLGLNAYMLEFDIPLVYYDWYYSHRFNTANRDPEPVREETVLQWKRQCEAEIAKRGLQFHDMGHGWNAEAFGIRSADGWTADKENPIPPEARQYLAMIDGQRGLFKGVALNTNFCMSNPEARRMVANTVVEYARQAQNVDFLHVWLADGEKNHCECPACREKTPSDWYVVLLNEIDLALAQANLSTRIVFCAYSDTAYEPVTERLKNPGRFTMLLGAISRSYCYSIEKDPQVPALTPFVLNRSGRLGSMEEYVVRAKKWREKAPCPSFAYEYHFWKHQFYAPGVLSFARRLHEDVLSYKLNGFDGMIQDGSQRSFFPNGLCWHIYAATLFDNTADPDALTEDYLRCAYGALWPEVLEYLQTIDTLMPQSYIEAPHIAQKGSGRYFRPEMEAPLSRVAQVTEDMAKRIRAQGSAPYRAQTVLLRMLLAHGEFCRGFAQALIHKCRGEDLAAKEAADAFLNRFGAWELAMERCYDHMMAVYALRAIFHAKSAFFQ